MKSQRLNVMAVVRLSVVILGGTFLTVLTPLSFAQSENIKQNSGQKTPDVEMYQNDAGEWKVRYLNMQTGANSSAEPQETKSTEGSAEADTDVDLYQDANGEWKVRYVPIKNQAKDSTKNEVKDSAKEEQAPAPVTADVSTTPVKGQESVEKDIEKDIDAQIQEQMGTPAKTPAENLPAQTRPSNENKKEIVSEAAAATPSAKSPQPSDSPAVLDQTPTKKSAKESEQNSVKDEPVDEFTALTEKIESSLPDNRENKSQSENNVQDAVKSATIDERPADAVKEQAAVVQNAVNSKETRTVPMDDTELTTTVDPAPAPQAAYVQESRPSRYPSAPDIYQPSISSRNSNHRVEFGVETFQFNFEQESLANNLGFEVGKRNKGVLYGLHGGYEYISDAPEKQSFMDFVRHFDDVNRYKVTLDYRTGSAEYSDRNFDGVKEDFNHHMVEARAVAGYDFRLLQNTRFTPFMGLGYRYHLDPSGTIIDAPPGTIQEAGTTNTFSSVGFDLRQPYEVQTHYLYVPIGVMTNTNIADSWSLGLNLEADVLCWGMIKSSFSDLGTLYVEDGAANPRTLRYKDTTNTLKSGFGFRGSTRLTKKQNNFDWYIEPFIRYWHISKSEEKQYPLIVSDGKDVVLQRGDGSPYNWTEPESSTTEYGLEVGVVY